ncbi:MAG: SRPBCC family protein [Solirubrobacteraceae bacterium]
MAENSAWVPTIPHDAWSIVADARGYAFWVIGADDIEGFDGDWPEVGATFRHAQGVKPLRLHDTTSVVAADPPHRLQLEVRARPLFIGIVTLTFTPADGGTVISIDERATGGVTGALPGFATAPLIQMRNAESVRRLAAMAWARATA